MPAPIGNKYAEGGPGPTKYKKQYDRQAYKLCLLGSTDKDLADFFEVDEATINRWKEDHPSFCKSVMRGKAPADAEVAESLFKRAKGYSHKEIDIRVIEGAIVQTPMVKHYPPETTAAIFWLKNRQKSKWRDKVETGVTDVMGNDVPVVTLFQIPDNGRNKDNQTAKGLPGESTEQSG